MTPVSTKHGTFSWTVADAMSHESLAPLLERFPELDDVAGASVIKRNHFRAVYHVPASACGERGAALVGSGGLIAKVYRYNTRWDRLRYRFFPSRAEQEWRALKRFGELGIPTAKALAVARWTDGGRLVGGGLVASFLASTVTINSRLHELHQSAEAAGSGQDVPGEALEILVQTGKLLAQVHEAGVWHRDLHGGNFLWSPEDHRLFLIDLHTCIFCRKLARWQIRQGLVKLLHSLGFSVPRAWLTHLLDAYRMGVRSSLGRPEAVTRRLFTAVAALERKRIRSRSKRCFLPSTRFEVRKSPGVRSYRLRQWDGKDWPAEDLQPLWQTAPPAGAIKRSRRGWVAVLKSASGASFCVKYRSCSLLEGFQALFESHRLRRAYAGGHALWVREVPSPQVVALREQRRFGLVREAYLVTELVPDALPLDRFLKEHYWQKPARPGEEARRKHLLARKVGGLVRALHDAGLYPHDLSPQNLLVTPEAAETHSREPLAGLRLIDLDHLYLWQPLSRRGKTKNLVQMGNLCEGHISTTDRLRAFRAYRGAPNARLATEKLWIRDLRRGILKEHRRVLEALLSRERSRGNGAV
jgi:tRNA A-37 threonylcarbamoyl transferase component Bud32